MDLYSSQTADFYTAYDKESRSAVIDSERGRSTLAHSRMKSETRALRGAVRPQTVRWAGK
jgi:hypothetical protein